MDEDDPPRFAHEATMLQGGKVTYSGTNDVNKKKEPGPNCGLPNLGLGPYLIHSTAPSQIPKAGQRSQELPSFHSHPGLSNLGWGQGLKRVGVAESGGGSEGHLVLNHGLSWSWGQVPIKQSGCENPVIYPRRALQESQGQQ